MVSCEAHAKTAVVTLFVTTLKYKLPKDLATDYTMYKLTTENRKTNAMDNTRMIQYFLSEIIQFDLMFFYA